MKYYIAENGQPAGPFEPSELMMHGLTVNSLVWCEGMPNWTSASQVPELMAILSGTSYVPPMGNTGGVDMQLPPVPPVGGQASQLPQVPPFGNQTQPTTTGTPYNQPNQPYAPPQYGPSNQPNNLMPKTWLTEAIIATVACLLCCFNYVGIVSGAVAIYKAMGVKSKFLKGDTAGATRDSSMARLMVLITAGVCVVWTIIQAVRLMNDPSLMQQIQEGTFGSFYGF